MLSKNIKAFTLVEIMVGILIVSIVMIGAFQALTSLGIGKIRLIQKTNTQKQALYFSEKLFEMIKYGGTIDYEEYFNRKIINQTSAGGPIYSSGHYQRPSGYGNFGDTGNIGTTGYGHGFYQCFSQGATIISDQGCFDTTRSYPQRYGQYSFQFRDYNSNANADGGDEDGNGNIIGDDDDEILGTGPVAFTEYGDVKELYLINGVKRQRTLFRYNVKLDPNAPPGATCSSSDNGATYTGIGCLGTIEYLVLDGRDWGLDHNVSVNDSNGTQYDGVIDTWLINEKFAGNNTTIAHSYNNPNQRYWQPLFSENIHVTEFKVFPHPNIDTNIGWKITDPSVNVAEYVRIQLGMQAAWRDRKKLQGNPREYKFTTTINLTDIFSR